MEFEFDPKGEAKAIKAREDLVERLGSVRVETNKTVVHSVIESLHSLRSPLAFEWEGRKPDAWYLRMDIEREIKELRR